MGNPRVVFKSPHGHGVDENPSASLPHPLFSVVGLILTRDVMIFFPSSTPLSENSLSGTYTYEELKPYFNFGLADIETNGNLTFSVINTDDEVLLFQMRGAPGEGGGLTHVERFQCPTGGMSPF